MWRGMLEEFLREKQYMAELASIYASLRVGGDYLKFDFVSYNDNEETFLADLFS